MSIKHLKYRTVDELINGIPNSFKNVPANNENIEQMKYWLNIILGMYKINISLDCENKIKEIENKLEQNIPKALCLLYSYFGSELNMLSQKIENKIMDYRLLGINEIEIEKNVIVYDYYSRDALYETDILIYGVTQKSRNLYAIDLNMDWQLNFNKKLYWEKDHIPLFQYLLILSVCILINNKENIFKTRIKNVSPFKLLETMDTIFSGDLERFNGFQHYSHTLYYNIQYGALGWFRAGNISPDLLFGCDNKIFTEEIIKKYNFNKAKRIKQDEK
jgi:hypothetical protein